jgi:hypothetical protein
MPAFSYLAYPVPGAKKELLTDLAALDYCEATPADNQEILILVTDTPDENKEKVKPTSAMVPRTISSSKTKPKPLTLSNLENFWRITRRRKWQKYLAYLPEISDI